MDNQAEEQKKLPSMLGQHSYLLPILAGFIAFISPLGYLIGLGYQSGYLGEFGVSTSAFPLSITDGYVNGYYVVLFYAVDLFVYISDRAFWGNVLTGLIILFVVMYLFVKVVRYGHPDSSKHIPIPEELKLRLKYLHPSQNDFTATVVFFFGLLTAISTVIYLIILFLFLWMMITFMSHEKGVQHALESKRNFTQNGCNQDTNSYTSTCVLIVDKTGVSVAEGLLISLHDKRFAVFTENGPIISELPEGAKIIKTFDKQSFLSSTQGTN